jgi:hypothetical protein
MYLSCNLPCVPSRCRYRAAVFELTGLSVVYLVLMAAGPQLLGHSAINFAVRRLPAAEVALAMLLEPLGSGLLAWLVLAEPPTAGVLSGGPLALVGVAVSQVCCDSRVVLPMWCGTLMLILITYPIPILTTGARPQAWPAPKTQPVVARVGSLN